MTSKNIGGEYVAINKFKRQKNHTGDVLNDLCRHDNNDVTYRENDKTVFFLGLVFYYYYSASKHTPGVGRASTDRRKTTVVKNMITINIHPETS